MLDGYSSRASRRCQIGIGRTLTVSAVARHLEVGGYMDAPAATRMPEACFSRRSLFSRGSMHRSTGYGCSESEESRLRSSRRVGARVEGGGATRRARLGTLLVWSRGTEAIESAITSRPCCHLSSGKQEERSKSEVESAINAGACWGQGGWQTSGTDGHRTRSHQC